MLQKTLRKKNESKFSKILFHAGLSIEEISNAMSVLTTDDIQKIAAIVRISRKTMRIVKQNIIFALGVKALVLLLGAFGAANMWEAVFADVGVSVIAIVNSMRTLRTK